MPRRYREELLGNEVMVVAVIEQYQGHDAEWAAYIGVYHEPVNEEEVKRVAQSGHKLYEKEARPFFPGLHEVGYRR